MYVEEPTGHFVKNMPPFHYRPAVSGVRAGRKRSDPTNVDIVFDGSVPNQMTLFFVSKCMNEANREI